MHFSLIVNSWNFRLVRIVRSASVLCKSVCNSDLCLCDYADEEVEEGQEEERLRVICQCGIHCVHAC